MNNTALVLSIVTLIIVVNGGTVGLFWRYVSKMKDKIQYKDVCGEIVKRIEQKGDERHQDVKEDLKEIKDLIRSNGNPKLSVQT